MIQVLIISSLYSQTQHLRRILLGQAGHIQLCGTADNSVLGMSLIESLHPDVVIMPVHMTFWNPEDLINYLLPRGICPRFVLLSDGSEAVIEGAAAVKVQQLLPDAMPSDAMLLHAVEEAGRLQKHETGAVRPPENEYVQHSLEVMELLMGLVPVGTGSAQQQFGRLHVGSQDCWILLGAQSDGQPGPRPLRRLCRAGIVFCGADRAAPPARKHGYLHLPRPEPVHPARRWAGCGAGLGALGGEDQRTGRASRARADDL